ncbi:serine threonine kinase [Penicillium cosmopolitanum]|uniref:Serine threonine kinase n=1 Tax=Penicillium cosmopolitanum TaxID=1131564 RepID=A0A9W9VQZ1_9EURO|nr:serine threonine kinase [Penicillium cosmopolitanum]KAJ5387539.1 serine threonine kinase [Penicillium cosmopolitanum]
MSFMAMSVEDLRVADTRFNFWREMIQPNGKLWPSFDDIKVFNENDKLLDVLAKALCEQNARYTPQDFKTAFEGAI